MTGGPAQSRRAFLGKVAALAGVGLGAQFLPQAAAGASVLPTKARALTGLTSTGAVGASEATAASLIAGFRPSMTTRLGLLETDAGLDPLAQGATPYREWTRLRLVRLEELHRLAAGPDGPDWRMGYLNRLPPLERNLPKALRIPFYTHMPMDTTGPGHGPLLRQRIADGVCNGIFLYMDPGTPMAPTATLDSITNSGPPVPIMISPKNVSDPVKLKAFMDYWAARPEWIPFVRVAFWQEPQGDFGGDGQPPVSVWQEKVLTLADAADRVGIASAAHVETWHLHPVYQPDGGIPRLLEMVEPVIHRLGGGISWSVFVFNQKPDAANDYVQWMDELMVSRFPYSSFGVSAYGDSVPPTTPPDDPLRLARAARVASALADADECDGLYGGYYAVPTGPDPSRDFWDPHVAAVVAAALEAA